MCCLFGMMDYGHKFSGRQKSRILSVLARECEVRGTDATGIAYNSGGRLRIYKRPVAAHKLRISIPDDVMVVMGHTRMTTQGSEKKNYNNHPFFGRAGSMRFALAHNGVIYNDIQLRQSLKLPKARIQTDSFIAVQLIEQNKALDLKSLKHMAETIDGSFSFTVLDARDRLYFVRGDNPLCIYLWPKAGLVLYASTEEILSKALAKLILPEEEPEKIPLVSGDILRIDPDGKQVMGTFHMKHPLPCWDLDWGYTSVWPPLGNQQYLDDLRSVAGAMGLMREDIDDLLAEGLSIEEVEEYVYDLARYEVCQ